MKRTIISIKGFDNTKNKCIGYVYMPIEVDGKMVHQKFYFFMIRNHWMLIAYLDTHLQIQTKIVNHYENHTIACRIEIFPM